MNSSYFRAAIRTSVFVAASLSVPLSLAAADRQQAQAQLLDHAEFLCANCFFGPSDYYYCFAVDNQILIAYQKTPVLNWQDQSKNYLTKVHGGWAAWAPPGQTVPIRYDNKHIWVDRGEGPPVRPGLWAHMKAATRWVIRADSKRAKLTRSSMRDIFTNNDRCRNADPAKTH